MTIKEKPHYTLSADTLAKWIEGQPDAWWLVDEDPIINSTLSLPCTSDELAPMIRQVGKNKQLLLQAKNPASQVHGEEITVDKLDDQVVTNRKGHKILRLTWTDSEEDWLLIEDEGMAA
jgi:hypothetical protein